MINYLHQESFQVRARRGCVKLNPKQVSRRFVEHFLSVIVPPRARTPRETYLRVFDHREVLEREREREREGRISFVGGYGDSSNELMQVELVLGIEITTVLLAKVVSRDT